MAEEEQTEAEDTGTGKKKLKMILLILAGVLLVAGVSVGATLFLLSPGAGQDGADEAQSEDGTETDLDAGPANYLAIEPAFVVNFNEAGRTRFLQLELSLLSRDPVAIDTANTHMPLLRNDILETLALQEFDTLKTVEGKEQLVESLTATVQATIEEKLGRPGFETVLFRSFVMQ